MADFNQAYKKMITHEGGYVNDPDDPGGETYKGVSRKNWGTWEGWVTIDLLKRQPGFPASLDRDSELQEQIKDFYRTNFWNKIQGDKIENQAIAENIFDFGVNAGISTAISIAQLTIGVKPDGINGNNTLTALNAVKMDFFLAAYTVAKIARYVNIVKKRPMSRKYFYGWVLRALEVTP